MLSKTKINKEILIQIELTYLIQLVIKSYLNFDGLGFRTSELSFPEPVSSI